MIALTIVLFTSGLIMMIAGLVLLYTKENEAFAALFIMGIVVMILSIIPAALAPSSSEGLPITTLEATDYPGKTYQLANGPYQLGKSIHVLVYQPDGKKVVRRHLRLEQRDVIDREIPQNVKVLRVLETTRGDGYLFGKLEGNLDSPFFQRHVLEDQEKNSGKGLPLTVLEAKDIPGKVYKLAAILGQFEDEVDFFIYLSDSEGRESIRYLSLPRNLILNAEIPKYDELARDDKVIRAFETTKGDVYQIGPFKDYTNAPLFKEETPEIVAGGSG